MSRALLKSTGYVCEILRNGFCQESNPGTRLDAIRGIGVRLLSLVYVQGPSRGHVQGHDGNACEEAARLGVDRAHARGIGPPAPALRGDPFHVPYSWKGKQSL